MTKERTTLALESVQDWLPTGFYGFISVHRFATEKIWKYEIFERLDFRQK